MSPLKSDQQAAEYVVQIKQLHAELVEVETKGFRQSLALAIQLGTLCACGHGSDSSSSSILG
jgi:hypothetical protein